MTSPGSLYLVEVAAAREAKLDDEPARLAALSRARLLDTAPEPAFDRITAMVRLILNVPIAAVSLIDTERQWFKSRQGLKLESTARDISFCTHTIQSRGPLVVADARADPRFHDNPLVLGEPGIASYAGVPLETPDGYNLGSLCAIDVVPRQFDEGQLAILASFAELVVGEFELRLIAERDSLTGALTRRALISEIEAAIAARDRDARASALIVFDIDHFRTVNDRFGHPAGDRVLKSVAARCRGAMRPGDVLGRIGGEEFALVLPDTKPGAAMLCAERLRLAIADTASATSRTGVYVTASFGVASLTPAIRSAADWLASVDEPLYAAKRAGRNTCRARNETTLAA